MHAYVVVVSRCIAWVHSCAQVKARAVAFSRREDGICLDNTIFTWSMEILHVIVWFFLSLKKDNLFFFLIYRCLIMLEQIKNFNLQKKKKKKKSQSRLTVQRIGWVAKFRLLKAASVSLPLINYSDTPFERKTFSRELATEIDFLSGFPYSRDGES